MPYSTRYPLSKFWLARSGKEAAIIIIIAAATALSCRPCGIPVLSLSIALLSHIHENQQGRRQGNDDETFQDTLIDLQLKVVIIANILIESLSLGTTDGRPSSQQFLLIFTSLTIQLGAVLGFFLLIILQEGDDPFFERARRSRLYSLLAIHTKE